VTDHNLNVRGIAANGITPGRRSAILANHLGGRNLGYDRRRGGQELGKVAALRKKLEKEEASSIDARLKNDQLDGTRKGLK
ncbi:hypothetical protein EV363DRAFT_1109293, partial [Boletus edulis]